MMRTIKMILLGMFLVLCLTGTVILGNASKKMLETMPNTAKKEETNQNQTKTNLLDPTMLENYDIAPFTTNLPVIFLDTRQQQLSKTQEVWGEISVLEPQESPRSIFDDPDLTSLATIKFRGASSYSNFDKKSFRIKFYKNKKKEKELSLAGMGAHSEWVLHGPYLDKTLMRNKLMYDLSREIMEWGSDSRYAEVVLDGDYQGVYLIVEPVTNGASRLRLSKFGLVSGNTAYIVKRDRIGTESVELETYGKLQGHTHNTLSVSYPSAKRITKQQKNYIQNDISAFEKTLYGPHFTNDQNGYANYIDVENWIDYLILNEVAMNYDAGNLSTYLYKELNGKMKLAVWDFNNSFDNYQWYQLDATGFRTNQNSWMERLCQDPHFVDRIEKRYKELRENVLSEQHLQQLLDSYQETLGEAIDRNFKVWAYSLEENLLAGFRTDGTFRDPHSFQEALLHLKQRIQERFLYLDKHIEQLFIAK